MMQSSWVQRFKDRNVIKSHKEQMHIRTEIVILTPVAKEDTHKMRTLMLHDQMEKTIAQMIEQVKEQVDDSFEADIESIRVSLQNIWSSKSP